MDYLAATLEVKAVQAQQRIISGLAAGIGNPDRAQDVILPGAFTKTLMAQAPGAVAVFIGHQRDSLPVGIPLTIQEVPGGLYTETLIKPGPAGDDLLATAEFLQRHGQALGMSIGYRVPPGGAKMARHGDKMIRELSEVELHEYSFAASQSIANPQALVTGVKQQEDMMPYRVEKRGGEYCVINPESGRNHGCHPTEAEAMAQMRALYVHVPDARKQDDDDGEHKAAWDTAYINALPDSAFLYVEGGGEKDDEGRTVPRGKRHFPYKDATGDIDLAHLRNAIARIPQSDAAGLNKEALQGRARRLLAGASGGGKTLDVDAPEWQDGYAPRLAYLGYALVDAADLLAEQHKAMALLHEDTKAGRRMGAAMREKLTSLRQALDDMIAWAEYADRDQDGAAKVARYRHELALLALDDLEAAG